MMHNVQCCNADAVYMIDCACVLIFRCRLCVNASALLFPIIAAYEPNKDDPLELCSFYI